jgi:hypothetical protein
VKIYRGYRTPEGARVEVDGKPLRHYPLHSPTGFEWGYGGSGPADLAVAILADVLGETPTRDELNRGTPECWRLHQEFKWDVVSLFDRDTWMLGEDRILAWLEPRRTLEATCIECGCTDSAACADGCSWLWVNREERKGLCSTHEAAALT